MKKNTVLVTGGSGYIGSHLVLKLIESGYNPTVFDINPPLSQVSYFNGDVCNTNDVSSAFLQLKPSVVVHLAAKTSVSESVKNPEEFNGVNIKGTQNVIEAAKEHKCKNFVFASSAAVYNNQLKLVPSNPYGETKLAAEKLLTQANGLHVCILRLFNVSGQTCGVFPSSETLFMKIREALAKNKPLVIYGNAFKTKDGTAIRDYVHVSDVVSSFSKAIKYLKTHKFGLYNIGSGQEYTNLEILRVCEKVAGKQCRIRFDSARKGEIDRVVAITDGARRGLGWEPIHSSLDGIFTSLTNRTAIPGV